MSGIAGDTDVYIHITNWLTGSFTCGAGHSADLTHFSQGSLFFYKHFMTLKCVSVCFFVVLCHPAAPDESENVQSDESENGTLSKSAL